MYISMYKLMHVGKYVCMYVCMYMYVGLCRSVQELVQWGFRRVFLSYSKEGGFNWGVCPRFYCESLMVVCSAFANDVTRCFKRMFY